MNPGELVFIDWLSFWCDTCDIHDGIMYKLVKTDMRTNVFSETLRIEDITGREVGILQYKPYSSSLPENGGIFKVDNELCYHENLIPVVEHILSDIHLHALSVNRIDFASDFTEIHGEYPRDFCRKLIIGKYRRVGAAKFFAHGEDIAKLDNIRKWGNGLWVGVTDVEAVGNGIQYDYIRYGKRNAACSTYMYNKSKELEEEADKPWIRHLWKQFKQAYMDNGDVWRIEFSVKGTKLEVIDKETGDILNFGTKKDGSHKRLSDLHWQDFPKYRHDIWTALARKYFDIRDGSSSTRTNRMTSIEYLSQQTNYVASRRYTSAKKPEYLDKVLLRKLDEYEKEFYIERPRIRELAHELGRLIAKEKDLIDWATKKGLSYR